MQMLRLSILLLLSTLAAVAGPNAPVPKAEILKLTGDFEGKKLSRDVNILWLSGPEDHKGGAHDYIRIKELFVPMLKKVPRVTVDEAHLFPTQEQFDKADLMIQFLHMPDLTDEQYAMYQKYVDGGGGVVSIHEACIMRPVDRADKYADCIGCSWNGNKNSRWGMFGNKHALYLDTEHPAFKGLPKSVSLNDESYWDLLKKDKVKVIGAVAPKAETDPASFADALKLEGVRKEAFWTYTSGKGRVFGTTTGHFTYTYFDPHYRILLMRGIGWALNEDPAPFMPLVFEGITSEDGLVGTTDSMMDYVNRKK